MTKRRETEEDEKIHRSISDMVAALEAEDKQLEHIEGTQICSVCHGTGKGVGQERCPCCDGIGRMFVTDTSRKETLMPNPEPVLPLQGDRPELLKTREATHGRWKDNATLLMNFLNAWNEDKVGTFPPEVEAAVIMNLVKIARIGAGGYDPEHAEDIIGYTQLMQGK